MCLGRVIAPEKVYVVLLDLGGGDEVVAGVTTHSEGSSVAGSHLHGLQDLSGMVL